MSKANMSNIIDDFFDANAMLEVCRGYTQADVPDMKALDTVLWNLVKTYERIYKQLRDID